MKDEKKVWETVLFSFPEDEILRELTAESSYVAKSLVGTGRPFRVATGVESLDCCDRGRPAVSRPLAFRCPRRDDAFPVGLPVGRVCLDRQPGGLCHRVARASGAGARRVHLPPARAGHRAPCAGAMVCHQAAPTPPDESARRQLQYEGALSAVKSDIGLARNRRPHRPTNYF